MHQGYARLFREVHRHRSKSIARTFHSNEQTFSLLLSIPAVSQKDICVICHSEFISESNSFDGLATLETPKRIRDDNCDTA